MVDEDRYELRAFRDADFDGVAAVLSASAPDHPVTAEYLRHLYATFQHLSQSFAVVVTERPTGAIVGSGSLFRIAFMDDPVFQWVSCDVLPARRRQGIGTRLYRALVAEAERRGLRGLRVQVAEDSPPGCAFAARQGFVERRRIWRSSLDVADADTTGLPGLIRSASAQGITFTTLAEEGADDARVLHNVHELVSDSGRDVPVLGPRSAIPFDEFRRFYLEGPNALPRAWYLAKDRERYVGTSFGSADPAQPGVLQQHYTGTRREYRSRGLARCLKLLLIEFARQEGYRRIDTSNDSLNLPMWTVNQQLGFRKRHERIQLEREFAGPGEAPEGSTSNARAASE